MITLARNLGWWIRDYAYAIVWQVRAFFGRTDPAGFRTGDGVPIVVIPGVYESWRFLQPLIVALHDRGHPVHVLDPLRSNLQPVPEGAARVVDYLAERDLRDVVLVAHSKGGLIGKHVMAFGAASGRIRGMVTVAAPFGGSVYARYLAVSRSLRIFSPRDETILLLGQQTAVNARIVSVYGRFDPHIPGGSALAGAKNVQLDTGGHFRILADPRIVAEVAAMSESA
ncbi:alpha/beta hydrolase [Microbacterium sp. cx-55]|uniref:esterase/lipase family protein n=1 Tax=Microbacterium sp. cx-55 TaxID=2875948 RepID=UPI001CBBC767|nr:alpha/beta hydrolase [Microbacterium sp. cx-55]MBZ4487871.1 alpha/beta hydrolase [Microbacterium sp. cx-55]UGB34718.1 alpha/beta hydrolase [Microbacterium sp. cx-55]